MSPYFGTALAAAAVAAPLLALVRRHAAALGLVDVPNARSSHDQPMPLGGGIAIVAGTVAGAAAALALTGTGVEAGSVTILGGALVVALVSLLDDIWSLPPVLRLGTHLLAAVTVVLLLPPLDRVVLPVVGAVSLGGFATPLAVLWIVGVTNIYNFMDGIDGLAGGQGLVAGAAWSLLGWLAQAPLVTALGLATGVSSLIFLARNWPPASIFMGDCGSAFLGFLLASLPLLPALHPIPALASAVLVLWPFLLDGAFTITRRLLRGENVFTPHRSHLYQERVRRGASHRRVSATYLGLSVLSSGVAIGWAAGSRWAEWSAPIILVAVAVLLIRSGFREDAAEHVP